MIKILRDVNKNAALIGAVSVIAGMAGRAVLADGAASEGVPQIVATTPAVSAKDVDPATTEITVTFDRDMAKGFSWTGGGANYPAVREGERPHWTEDRRTCVLPVRLEPGRHYRLGLNSLSHKNFQSACGVPLDPVVYTFTTVGYTNQTALPSNSLKTGVSTGTAARLMKKFPDVSGVVIDGTTDTSLPKLEAVVSCLMAQQAAVKAGDMTRYHELERQGASNLLNVVTLTRPLPHATVSLFSHESELRRDGSRTATADAEGKFEFFDVPQGLYRIVAQDVRKGTNGCPAAEMTVEHYRTREHVQIVIHPQTVTVKGRVTDSQGHPLTNATVSAKQGHERYVPSEGDFTRAYHATTALTDSEGRYELRGLVPAGLWEARGLEGGGYGGAYAWYTVAISAPGYVPAKALVPVVPEETRRVARTLTGLLKKQASPYDIAGRREAGPVAQPPCQGHTLSGVDFTIYRAARIEGVFVNKSDDPQPRCTVLLSLTNRMDSCSYRAFTEASLWAKCDTEGRFRFDGVAPGAYKLQAYEDHRLVSGKPPMVVTVRESEPVSGLRLMNDTLPCGRIEGVVVDAASGKPVKGVTICSVNKQTGSTDCPPFLCLCGKVGYHTAECNRWIERVLQTNDMRVSTFVVEKAAPGQTELVVKAPEYAEEHVLVDVAPKGVARPKITLWRDGTVRIRPVIKDGARVDQYATVAGMPPFVDYVAVPQAGGQCVSGGKPSKQAGYDEFAGLKPGRYTLRGQIRYLPGAVSRYETVSVEIASAQTNEVALAFDGTCGIKLELAFAPGTAVSMRLETADTPSGLEPERNLGLRATLYAREPGTFLIPDLKPGAYRLSLFCKDVADRQRASLKKEPDRVRALTLNAGDSPTVSFSF